MELLILPVVMTAIAVLVSFGYGIRALHLMRDQPNNPTLRLAALNLLEPSVTIFTLLLSFVGVSIGGFTLAVIPLTVMLLAPLVTRAASPLHRVIAVYGCLRWLNTMVFWGVGVAALGNSSSNDKAALAGLLMCSGLAILFVSVAHIASSLETLKTQRVQ